MKALFISNVLESVATFRRPLIRRLRDLGYEVICLAGNSSLSFAEPRQALSAEGVIVHEISLAPASLSLTSAVREICALAKEIHVIDPDIVFTHTIKPNVLGILASYWLSGRKNRRIFATINGLGFAFLQQGFRARLYRSVVSLLYRYSLRHAERVFFFNHDDLKLFINQGIVSARKAGYLPGSGVDTDRYPPLELESGRFQFLFIGRLIREKGIYEFVEAAKIIHQKYPECTFEIVGGLYPSPTSVTQEQLNLWSHEKGLRFLGPVADVTNHIRRCTYVVLPSYREGLSQSLLEAMSSARPIITTRAPGCQELVSQGENGFLCDPRSTESLASAMEQAIIARDRAAEMGKVSRRIAIEKFSCSTMLETLFNQIDLVPQPKPDTFHASSGRP